VSFLFAMFSFSLAMSISPGPVNMIILSSGVNFCYVSLAAWAFLGEKVSFLLNSHFRLRLFNLSTGLLLIVTAIYLCYTHLT
jgi:threonine/homoserine/homoserine lactone efflux protein